MPVLKDCEWGVSKRRSKNQNLEAKEKILSSGEKNYLHEGVS